MAASALPSKGYFEGFDCAKLDKAFLHEIPLSASTCSSVSRLTSPRSELGEHPHIVVSANLPRTAPDAGEV